MTTIGMKTEGKTVGSVTLYDSDNYRRANANPNHSWAIQPIVLEIQNKLGENYPEGFDPTIELSEDYSDLGILGDVNEPYLQRAIQFITTGNRSIGRNKRNVDAEFTNSRKQSLTGSNMYVDRVLPILVD